MPEEEATVTIDWTTQPRRPFKRGFVPYGLGTHTVAEAKKRRKAIGIGQIEDPAGEDATPPPIDAFEELGVLPPWLLEALRDDERYEPWPMQAQTLPIAAAGQNIIGIARTGCGQAASYLLPGIVHIDDQPPLTDEEPGPVVLILTSSQESAAKVWDEAKSLLRYSSRGDSGGGLRAVNVSGGGSRKEKLEELTAAGAHIVMGTPKRLHDMAMKEQISLLRVTYFVLDGAGSMLDLGFLKEVQEIAGWVRPERQTLLFSTTWPKAMHELSLELCRAGGQPVRINVTAAPPKPAPKPAPKAAANGAKKGSDEEEKDSDKEAAEEEVEIEEEEVKEGAEEFPDNW